MERRQFFYLAGLGTSTLLASNLLTSCSKDDDEDTNGNGNPSGSNKLTISLTDPAYSSLAANGGSVIKDNILIIHTTGTTYLALSKICTHQGCIVGFNGTNIVCPCHGSQFSTTGAVLQGPAASPLKSYSTSVSGETLTISLS